jgi:hypothetical protein
MDRRIAFSYSPSGIRIANLRQSVEFWKAEPHDMNIVRTLKDDITTGALRFRGGLELMRRLRECLGNIDPQELLLLWLAAVQEHPRYQRTSLDTLARMFVGHQLRIDGFIPLPAQAAA